MGFRFKDQNLHLWQNQYKRWYDLMVVGAILDHVERAIELNLISNIAKEFHKSLLFGDDLSKLICRYAL